VYTNSNTHSEQAQTHKSPTPTIQTESDTHTLLEISCIPDPPLPPSTHTARNCCCSRPWRRRCSCWQRSSRRLGLWRRRRRGEEFFFLLLKILMLCSTMPRAKLRRGEGVERRWREGGGGEGGGGEGGQGRGGEGGGAGEGGGRGKEDMRADEKAAGASAQRRDAHA